MATSVNNTTHWRMDRPLSPLPTPIPPPDTWRLVTPQEIARAASLRYGVSLDAVTAEMRHTEFARLLSLAGYTAETVAVFADGGA